MDETPPVGEIPPELRLDRPLRLPEPLAEAPLGAHVLELAAPNSHCDEAVCFLGAGTYDHHVPAIVEAIAGRLPHLRIGPGAPLPVRHTQTGEAFLRLVFDLEVYWQELSALEVAFAPLADGPHALVEALKAAARVTGRREAVVARSVNPTWRQIANTLTSGSLTLREVGYHGGITRPGDLARLLSSDVACVVVEHPNYFGCLEDVASLGAVAHEAGALLVVKADPISLGVLRPPGELGADIAVADAQALGSRPAWGGNSIGLLACSQTIAQAVGSWRVLDREGRSRHEGKAEAAILAERVARPVLYLAAVGGEGLRRAATLSTAMAHKALEAITRLEGFEPRFRAPFFKDFVVESLLDPREVAEALLESNILGGLPLQDDYPEMENCLLFAATERRTEGDIELLRHTLELIAETDFGELETDADYG